MSKNLVIVESPGKIRTIERYLKNIKLPQNGPDSANRKKDQFKVLSSYGHVRDLPKSGLRLDPEEPDWAPEYQVMPDKEKRVDQLKKAADAADQVFLATDLDREGEAIAWHLREVLGGEDERYVRVIFNEITEAAIAKAFAEPGVIDVNRVNAQQARRFLDRVVGYKLTPLLYKKVARGLSAGRVQSVAVRLVVEREREIRAFKPNEYWELFADLAKLDDGVIRRFKVEKFDGAKLEINSEEQANDILSVIEKSQLQVSAVTKRKTSSRPSAPFITSTLQQAAANRFGFPVKRTMSLAQNLYEAGLITYMRTDSTNISAYAQESAAKLIKTKFGDSYLPEKPNKYSSKASAQEAHEAIRPSDVNTQPDGVAILLNRQRTRAQDLQATIRLYELIWQRFVASQMTPAQYESTSVAVKADRYELNLSGRRTLFDGYTRVMPSRDSDSEKELPSYTEGETLRRTKLEKKQHFTKPPARYNEASLVRELEKRGIGRPSTYSSIISTIQDRGYVTIRAKRFYAERIAEVVTDRLLQSFEDLLTYEFTAEMEKRLDQVAEGDSSWLDVLNGYYDDFAEKLATANDPTNGMHRNEPVKTDIPCEKCGRPMLIRVASSGTFLACSGYALPKEERCTHTVNFVSDENAVRASPDAESTDDEDESRRLLAKRTCPKCSSSMDGFIMSKSEKIHVCGNMPTCTGYETEQGTFDLPTPEVKTIECNVCGGVMELKNGRFGAFYGCTNPSCNNTRKPLPDGTVAAPPVPMPELRVEEADDFYVLREGKAGIFLGASRYPKVRKIRQPRIKELKNHANELDPKFQFLLTAPDEDLLNNDVFVQFGRKDRKYFLESKDLEYKKTGWTANLIDGVWVPKEGQSKPKPRKSR